MSQSDGRGGWKLQCSYSSTDLCVLVLPSRQKKHQHSRQLQLRFEEAAVDMLVLSYRNANLHILLPCPITHAT